MSIFEDKYAKLYEIIYANKDYSYEVSVVQELLKEISPNTLSLLDFGCGTGKHATLFSKAGFQVTGIDRSNAMLDKAKDADPGNQSIYLHINDANKIKDSSIDATMSLFDVFSYLVCDNDIKDFFELILKKSKVSSPLIFDFWYLPAVIHLKPKTRKKLFLQDNRSITRITEPIFDISTSQVKAKHEFFLKENNEFVDCFSETHTMRCFTKNEIIRMLDDFGYRLIRFGTWQKPLSEPTLLDWSVLAIAVQK